MDLPDGAEISDFIFNLCQMMPKSLSACSRCVCVCVCVCVCARARARVNVYVRSEKQAG